MEPWVAPDHEPLAPYPTEFQLARKEALHRRVSRRYRNRFEPSAEATAARAVTEEVMNLVGDLAHELVDRLPEGRYLSMVLTDLEAVEHHAREAAFQDVP